MSFCNDFIVCSINDNAKPSVCKANVFRGCLTPFHPTTAGAGGVVEAFAGCGEEFAAAVGEADEFAAGRTCVARHPGASLAGGIINTFCGDGKQLVAVG